MASERRLEGRVAIVTGAARGTGEAIARLFAQHRCLHRLPPNCSCRSAPFLHHARIARRMRARPR